MKTFNIYPVGEFDLDYVGTIDYKYYDMMHKGLKPIIFILNKNKCQGFSEYLAENDLVIGFIDDDSKDETKYHKCSYALNKEEKKRLLGDKVKIKDLNTLVESKQYNL